MENKRSVYVLVGIAAVLLISLFYWFEYRPSQIRKQCSDRAYSSAMNISKKEDPERAEQGLMNTQDWNAAFQVCLLSEGLEPTQQELK